MGMNFNYNAFIVLLIILVLLIVTLINDSENKHNDNTLKTNRKKTL